MLVGLVSDTHGVWDPALAVHFRGVQHICHAGDIGSHGGHDGVLAPLRALAPVTAVRGNVDDSPGVAEELPESAVVTLAGWRLLVVHILADADAEGLLAQHPVADIVVHGHSHNYGVETVEVEVAAPQGGTARQLRINPGSAGPARFKLGRCAALLTLPDRGSGGWPTVQRIELAPKAPPRLPAARARPPAPQPVKGKRKRSSRGARSSMRAATSSRGGRSESGRRVAAGGA